MSIDPGSRLGPYEILSSLGAGGMGEVYKARDTRLDRTVAIKVLPAHLSENPELRQRFEREARTVSSLAHPHICALYDVGHQDGVDFLVMEFLEGETLADRLARGLFPTGDLLRIGVEIADALQEAHRAGVVHRDLKPGNVMLGRGGVKLLDFGLAKVAAGPGSPASEFTALATEAAPESPLTTEGTILGTFQYMAPEQLEGQEADARSDLFALGAILYEMATGEKAFRGRTQASLVASILKEEPRPLSALQPMAPPALDRLLRACLAKDPDERIQTAHDVKLHLQWIAEGGSQVGVPAPVAARRKIRSRLAWALAGLFALLAAAFGAGWYRSAGGEVPVVRAHVLPPEGTVFELQGIHPGPAVLSPDGGSLAFVARGEDGIARLYVRPLASPEARPLPGTEGAGYPFWSPDSRSIGFFADGKLRTLEAAGGPALALCDAPLGKGGTWGPGGVILFSPNFNTPIHRVSAAGGDPEPVTEIDSTQGVNSHRHPHFLPDGRHFLYLARKATGVGVVRLASLDGGEERELMTSQSNAAYASGHLLFTRERTLMARPFDPGKLRFTGDAFPVAEDVTTIAGAFVGIFSASRNGVLAYLTGAAEADTQLAWRDRTGADLGPLGEPVLQFFPALSPDGRSAAVAIPDDRTGTGEIWIYEVARGLRTRFTFDPAEDLFPVWSPEGNRLAFASSRGGHFDLYLKSVAGSGAEEPLLESEEDKFPTGWSPDGRFLAFQRAHPETRADLWILPLAGEGDPYPLVETEFGEGGARFSPDGRWIAYVSDESGRDEIYVRPFPGPGRKWQVSTAGGEDPHWRQDGREIVYLTPDFRTAAAEVDGSGDTFRVGETRVLFENQGPVELEMAAGGERFLINAPVRNPAAFPLTLVLNWTADLRR